MGTEMEASPVVPTDAKVSTTPSSDGFTLHASGVIASVFCESHTPPKFTSGECSCLSLVWAGDAATNEKAVVHVIDDDESLRDALNGLLCSVGLETRTHGSVRQFLDAQSATPAGKPAWSWPLASTSAVAARIQYSVAVSMPTAS
jgi:hypothetical protein